MRAGNFVLRGQSSREVRPADTVARVTRFVDHEWLAEVEAGAFVE